MPTVKRSRSVFGNALYATSFLALCSLPASVKAQCQLNSSSGRIEHVVYVQFDNVHFTRDNPNVPSDLEQMPNLLNFVKSNGTLLANHHTPLISHTADDILTSLTGVYPNRQGQAVANSYGIFTPTGIQFPSSFTYWTDPARSGVDNTFNLLTATGANAPAPWVPFTRAGCNVGAVSIADMELENTSSDVTTVFGSGYTGSRSAADLEGIAVHCAASSTVCSSGVADLLPDEPGGYAGFKALFGHINVAPVISPNGPLTDLSGNKITGFPGFGGITAAQSLAYVAAMLEHDVPVVFAYISDAHDDHVNDVAFGPGQAGYVAQLKSYDQAWAAFFQRLANDGITTRNTLFIVTADENDHFAGGPPTPANCDGVTVPCTYAKIGEIDVNTQSLLDKADPSVAATPFSIHFDMAPAFYIQGQPQTGDPILRAFEKTTAQLTAVNPITGKTDNLTRYLADRPELQILHMITADPQRTPSFVMFGNPDYFFQTSGPDTLLDPGFAWNHGGVSPDINVTWLGLAGPGVARNGVDSVTWSDHTDIRPTLLLLTGLTDDYSHDGRVLVEALHTHSLSGGIAANESNFIAVAQAYKQLNAPVGELGLDSLSISTTALSGTDEEAYNDLETKLTGIAVRRDLLAVRMKRLLDDAEFGGKSIDFFTASQLVAEADRMITHVSNLKNRTSK